LVASAVTPSIAASLVSTAVGLSERGGLGRR
jgi:biopolymer transport protein ExbB/TolQ